MAEARVGRLVLAVSLNLRGREASICLICLLFTGDAARQVGPNSMDLVVYKESLSLETRVHGSPSVFISHLWSARTVIAAAPKANH